MKFCKMVWRKKAYSILSRIYDFVQAVRIVQISKEKLFYVKSKFIFGLRLDEPRFKNLHEIIYQIELWVSQGLDQPRPKLFVKSVN